VRMSAGTVPGSDLNVTPRPTAEDHQCRRNEGLKTI
jgi:hypothetical protein